MWSLFGNSNSKWGEGDQRGSGVITQKAVNAVKRGPISFDTYSGRILVRGRFSPAVDALCQDMGEIEAWDFLKDLGGVAFGVDSDTNIRLYFRS